MCLEDLDEEQVARWQVSESDPLIPKMEAVFFVLITDLAKTKVPPDTQPELYKLDVKLSSTCFLTLTKSSLCS